MFLTKLPDIPGAPYRQVDIRLCPTASLPYMLLGNSGDDNLMKLLRWRAMEKGLALNEYGMGKRDDKLGSV
jgi:DNA polymerase beta